MCAQLCVRATVLWSVRLTLSNVNNVCNIDLGMCRVFLGVMANGLMQVLFCTPRYVNVVWASGVRVASLKNRLLERTSFQFSSLPCYFRDPPESHSLIRAVHLCVCVWFDRSGQLWLEWEIGPSSPISPFKCPPSARYGRLRAKNL